VILHKLVHWTQDWIALGVITGSIVSWFICRSNRAGLTRVIDDALVDTATLRVALRIVS